MPNADTSNARVVMIGLIVGLILYGIYIVLFGTAIFLLVTKRSKNTVTGLLFLITIIMFGLCTAFEGVGIRYTTSTFLWQVANADNNFNDAGNTRVQISITLAVINSIIGDAVVIWRVWTLWSHKWRIVTCPGIGWLTSMATGIGCAVASGIATSDDAGALSNKAVAPWAVTFVASTFITNCTSVIAIAYRYIIYQREVGAVLANRHSSLARDILLLAIECGALYCLTWIVIGVLYVAGGRGVDVAVEALPPLAGIYPTLIIILVCLKITQQDSMHQFRQSRAPAIATVTTGALTGSTSHATYEMQPIRVRFEESRACDEQTMSNLDTLPTKVDASTMGIDDNKA